MFHSDTVKPSILITDDSPSILKILNESIKDLATIFFATSGRDAISIAQQDSLDLIILDIEMPEMDGYETYQQIRALPGHEDTPVIFITSHNDGDHELKTLEMGAADYISKPIDIAITKARVNTQLTLQRQSARIQKNADDITHLMHALPAFVAYWDGDGHNIYCNDIKGHWFNTAATQMLGQHISEVLPAQAYRDLSNLNSLQKTFSMDIDCHPLDEAPLIGQLKIVPRDSDNPEQGFLTLIHDITARKLAEQSLIDEKERMRVTLSSIGDAVIATDTKGLVTFLNPIAEEMTGWSFHNALGQTIETVMPLFDADSGAPYKNPIRLALKEERIVGMALNCCLGSSQTKCISVEDSAAPIRNHEGKVTGAIIVFHDVSEARAMAIKMTHLAQHDPLTDLPNRLLLRDRAQQAINKARGRPQKVAMIMIDLDDFKGVNELVGHEVGDMILQQIAYELQVDLSLDGNLFRPGGDEFLILLSDLNSSIEVTRHIHLIEKIFNSQWEARGEKLKISASIGVSIYPEDSRDLDELYRHSESALFSAKAAGKNQYSFYNDQLEKKLQLKHQLEKALSSKNDRQCFEIHYQPKVNTNTQQILGVEALVRWRNHDNQLISPCDFIPIAEETGLIIPLGEHILYQACSQAARWQQRGHQLSVAINVSTVQFEDKHFIDTVKSVIESTDVNPNLIEIELTESVLAKNIEHAKQLIHDLKEIGVNIALDDFGTGYSSLSYIKDFPLDTLKIDQSFVKNMLHDATNLTIIAAIIQMANGLKLSVVAEGVESEEHAEKLSEMGCPIMQGYFYSRPIPEAELTEKYQLS
ncbi:Cyclic di-GMP phosphodiesterase Gmr [Marinomonas aquimarina]|uniref:Cyclic di-GMP phosphodiesterase Gmr n=2 Tax=Marinomonas aquimarina TaxID=295068 RepID=A0A1A8TKQ0_9GAMM|nr:EAL domain-containing protein [Marinomonas aquimarina]SBS33287.1 Cyclic di-GMP phosphodiesterase Gmr [Marinomonas aquimarina]